MSVAESFAQVNDACRIPAESLSSSGTAFFESCTALLPPSSAWTVNSSRSSVWDHTERVELERVRGQIKEQLTLSKKSWIRSTATFAKAHHNVA